MTLYLRALRLLGAEGWWIWGLVLANALVALVQLAEPVLFGRVIDALSRQQPTGDLILLWAGLGTVGILAGVTVAVSADRMAHRRRLAAMAAAFERAMTLPISWHAERGTGSVVRAILAGTDGLFWLWLSALREQVAAVVGVLCLVPLAIILDWRMAAVLGLLAVSFVAANALVVSRTSAGQSAVERYHSEVYGRVGDVLANVTVVQSYSRFAAEMAAMRGLMEKVLAEQYPVLTWWGLLTVLTSAASTITMVVVFALGSILAARGEISVGEIVSFIALAGLLISKLDHLSAFAVRTFQSAPVLRSYFDLADQAPAVHDAADARPLGPVTGTITYHGVSYRYGSASGQGVFDISFEVPAGRTVALVGATGSGKTTTLALLQRVREPEAGQILVDGVDIATIRLSDLRAAVAVVFQDAGLFNRSIAENIRLGRPDATDAEVEAAARAAEAHDFIQAKPGGYGFVIGERGLFLSGGERQRLAIARAILKDAPILILDEATSALDPTTEMTIKRALDRLRQGRTTLIIAHRLSTIADADEILVLQAGRIVERGRFGDLAAAGGVFSGLVASGDFHRPRPDTPEEVSA
ncbi:MAG: glucan ABC transporter ATP-binding protein/ permease [Alphaproteobacteria bacterium]|nr:glucan ABC transporter ATP-binding protein/ permease [Alphaproteobacteria bacterium]